MRQVKIHHWTDIECPEATNLLRVFESQDNRTPWWSEIRHASKDLGRLREQIEQVCRTAFNTQQAVNVIANNPLIVMGFERWTIEHEMPIVIIDHDDEDREVKRYQDLRSNPGLDYITDLVGRPFMIREHETVRITIELKSGEVIKLKTQAD